MECTLGHRGRSLAEPGSFVEWMTLIIAAPPPLAPQPWTRYTQTRALAQRQTKGTAWLPMAVASTFIPGLNPQNPHYIPGYTGHCPLLRFSMGQTYGQVTGQLLQGPPVHRTLLPPIRRPRSPEVPRESLPLRRGHERLSSSMIPGYTGFVPRAQFIFAKNCSKFWAEALSDFTHLHGKQGSEELPKEAKGRKDTEKDQVPEPEGQLEETALEVVEQGPSEVLHVRLHRLCAPRPLPLWLQLSCAYQPGTAGFWAEALTRQCPGPQTSPLASQDIPSEPGSFT
ncbi:protein FAM166B isoform X5 [Hylobates moloch]|uniref:protein FAM166B isoform X5 n=1 Tax=Hylobates moloch TaxID=81572 RepID=UPI002674693A|nr:protein FAM166B isoform X5 [Hylobates moloch]